MVLSVSPVESDTRCTWKKVARGTRRSVSSPDVTKVSVGLVPLIYPSHLVYNQAYLLIAGRAVLFDDNSVNLYRYYRSGEEATFPE